MQPTALEIRTTQKVRPIYFLMGDFFIRGTLGSSAGEGRKVNVCNAGSQSLLPKRGKWDLGCLGSRMIRNVRVYKVASE